MAIRAVTIELPDEVVAILGSAEIAAERAKQALVLDLLRSEVISQGKAAQLLGITRWDILDLMAQQHIESGPKSAEEIRSEIEHLRSLPSEG